MKKVKNKQSGFTLIELMVSMSIFAIVCAGIVTYISDSLGRIGIETKASLVSQELKNAVGIMQSELRMSNSASPYNVGINPAVITCRSAFIVTATQLKFIVSYDDATANNGIRTYYVGYEYDPVTETLFRGEVATGTTSSCTLPAIDPLHFNTRQIIASNVVRIDANNDGTLDNIFQLNGNQLQVRLGTRVNGARGLTVLHQVSNNVLVRVA